VKYTDLVRYRGCLICRTVRTIVDALLAEHDLLQAYHTSHIMIRNGGPYFLDEGPRERLGFSFFTHRSDLSNPGFIAVRILMGLAIEAFPFDVELTSTIRKMPSFEVKVTPQIMLRYTYMSLHQRLVSVEPWETSYFDISMLKKWIRACDRSHGQICSGEVKYQTSEWFVGVIQ